MAPTTTTTENNEKRKTIRLTRHGRVKRVHDVVSKLFFDDADGNRASATLGKYDAVSCPAGIPHGFINEGTEDVLMQTMIGTGKPGPVAFIDDDIYEEEIARLASRAKTAAE